MSTIDQSTCVQEATVTLALYASPDSGVEERFSEYVGTVQPHHELKILLQETPVAEPAGTGKSKEARELIVDRRADLAVIRLKKPVGPEYSVALLGKDELDFSKPPSIVIVGFGAGKYDKGSGRYIYSDTTVTRRVGKNTVAQAPSKEGVFKIKAPESLSAGGDSGGPCFHENKLVGVISGSIPDESTTCTSIQPYLEWLNKEIEQARKG